VLDRGNPTRKSEAKIVTNIELGLQQLNLLADSLNQTQGHQLRQAIDLIMSDLPQSKPVQTQPQKKD
jgi:ABC-type uncharacterized transport system ATPase component